MNPFQPEKIYNTIFNLTDTRVANEKKWSREALIRISSAIDIALLGYHWKKAELPLYQYLVATETKFLATLHARTIKMVKTMSNLKMK